MIVDKHDVCTMVLFKFILLPRDNKLKILEHIRLALLEGDDREDAYRYSQGYIDERSWVKYLNFSKKIQKKEKTSNLNKIYKLIY